MKLFRYLITFLLTVSLLMSLGSCSGNDKAENKAEAEKVIQEEKSEEPSEEESDNNIIIGDFLALYKGYEIAEDTDGDPAIIISFDFTNNSEEESVFAFEYYYSITQKDIGLSLAVVWKDVVNFVTYDKGSMDAVAPGETIEVVLTYKLIDTESPVEMNFFDIMNTESDSLTIEL